MPDQGLSKAFSLMRGAYRNGRKQVGLYRLIESKACKKDRCYQLCIFTGTNADDVLVVDSRGQLHGQLAYQLAFTLTL